MRTDTPQAVRLEDYRPSDYLIDRVGLDVRLHPSATRVSATLSSGPTPPPQATAPLVLDGDELRLIAVAVDGRALQADDYEASPEALTIHAAAASPLHRGDRDVIDPTANTKLMGLYRSQRQLLHPVRGAGLSPHHLFSRPTRRDGRLHHADRGGPRRGARAARQRQPVEGGAGPDGWHFAVWHDPYPKPSYLFALVGGDSAAVAGRFPTRSGRDVPLAIYVEPGKEDRAAYAMDALKRSMRWDEETFGREYDLDVFNIVAVVRLQHGRDGEQGPQHLQRQIRARRARDRDRRRLRRYRGDHRA